MEMDIRQVSQEELKVLSELEAESFPPDEADSYESFLYRWKAAPDLTLAGFRGEETVGGIALQLLKRYVQNVQREQRDATQILLLSKSNMIPLYTRAGFVLREKQEVVHGKDTWYELVMPISDPSSRYL